MPSPARRGSSIGRGRYAARCGRRTAGTAGCSTSIPATRGPEPVSARSKAVREALEVDVPREGQPSAGVASQPVGDNAPERGTVMRALLRRRPSPAMVVACIALAVALTGTSFAAVSALAPNSVGPRQLQAGAVTNPKLRNNAVTSIKVRNRSLLRSDFAPGQLPAGPIGPQGPAGPAGPAGAAGPAGVIGAITVRSNSVSVDGGTAHNGEYNSARV